MAVRPNTLENRERELQLVDRTAEVTRAELAGEAVPAGELETLKSRIRELKLRDAQHELDKEPHCRDCFVRGVRATLKALE